jgi:hypothetical protein
MKEIAIASVLALVGANLAFGQLPATPAGPIFTPGLGEFMTFTQVRHAKLWLAGNAGNWELADYEIDELKEGLENVAKYVPAHLARAEDDLLAPPLKDKLRFVFREHSRSDSSLSSISRPRRHSAWRCRPRCSPVPTSRPGWLAVDRAERRARKNLRHRHIASITDLFLSATWGVVLSDEVQEIPLMQFRRRNPASARWRETKFRCNSHHDLSLTISDRYIGRLDRVTGRRLHHRPILLNGFGRLGPHRVGAAVGRKRRAIEVS